VLLAKPFGPNLPAKIGIVVHSAKCLDHSKLFPDHSKNCPDCSKNFPNHTKNFPDSSSNISLCSGYIFTTSRNIPEPAKYFPDHSSPRPALVRSAAGRSCSHDSWAIFPYTSVEICPTHYRDL